MAEPLKSYFSPALVRDIGASIARVHAAFPEAKFVREATRGLEELELLDRARHIGRAMAGSLPARYEDAIDVLMASLGREHDRDELTGTGMTPFFYMPHLVFVAERGLEEGDFERSMLAQKELTKRFTAEFSIRAFLDRYPERTLAVLAEWAGDESAHVRRLVSEGTRPRLPWGTRVRYLDEHPEKTVPLLERLKDDPTTLVRRSVANHLNDIGKARPDLLVEICRRWLEGAEASVERRALVEHALRSAVKRGVPGALELLGHGEKARVAVEDVRFEPERVAIGGKVRVTFVLRSEAKKRDAKTGAKAGKKDAAKTGGKAEGEKSQSLLVDLAVHFVKARGATSAKVFKVTRVKLPPGGRVELSKVVSLAVHTTRTPYVGTHRVDVLVNGSPLPAGAFEVVKAAAERRAGAVRGAR